MRSIGLIAFALGQEKQRSWIMSDDPYDKIKDLPLLERAQLMSERPHMFYFDIGHYWNIVEELVEHVQTVEAERDFFDQERIKAALREEELGR